MTSDAQRAAAAAANVVPVAAGEDSRLILAAVLANPLSNVFLVAVHGPDRFTYAILDREIGRKLRPDVGAGRRLTPADLFHPDDAAAVIRRYRECVASAAPLVYEECLRTRDGSRWWQTSLSPVKGADGAVTRILGIAIDITDRKLAESQLSEAQQQFATIVANLPGVVFRRVRHPDGRLSYSYVSAGIKTLLGYDSEALIADAGLMLRAIDPRDREAFDATVRRSAETLQPFALEMRVATASGDIKWLRSAAQTTRAEDGSIVWDGLILDVSDRKMAEAQVAEREARLRDFADAASDWLWETDEELRFTRISDRFFEIYGIDPSAIVGRRRDEFADMNCEPERWQDHIRAMTERQPFRDFVYRYGDGSGKHSRYIKVSGKPVFDESGRFRGYRGTGTDLTAQRRAEKTAAAASLRLLASIEALSEAVAIFDAADRLVLCNARYRGINESILELLVPGTPFETLVRVGITRGRFPEASASGDEEAWLAQRLERHRSGRSSFEQLLPTGQWMQVLEQATPDGGTIILATDVTALKRREEALKILTAEDGSDVFSRTARALIAGTGYRWAGIARVVPHAAAAVARSEVLALVDGATPLFPAAFDPAAGDGDAEPADAGALAANAASRLMAALGGAALVDEVVSSGDGTPIGHVFAIDDRPDHAAASKRDTVVLIAARVAVELQRLEAERQLLRAKETAELASRAKSEFLANMSHELRTPLNAVIGFSQMIGDEYLGPVGVAAYKEYAKDIHTSSTHLLQIINDILDVSKIEAGMLTLHESETDVAAAVEACGRLVRARAAEAGITLAVEIADGTPPIFVDERMIKQITLNLLSNALKFTPRNGTISISGGLDADGGFTFSVRDTGIGIAPEDFAKVLQPFGQVESSLARKFAGTGLGLPLTKGLVELHGGTLRLDSKVGSGTVVTVTLPPARTCKPLPDLSDSAAAATIALQG